MNAEAKNRCAHMYATVYAACVAKGWTHETSDERACQAIDSWILALRRLQS